MTWPASVEAALAFIAGSLGRRGQWPGWVAPEGRPDDGRRDLAAPLTALGVLALTGIPDAGDIIRRSREHIALTALPDGSWRYYADIPPDTDDTAMCALALDEEHRDLRHRTATWLASTVLPDGRFPTWAEPGWAPVVDAVPNAHVVAVLGARPETRAAIAWLLDVVDRGSEVAESAYYPDPLDLHVALARAVAAGVTALHPAVTQAARHAVTRLDDPSPYRVAQAIVVLHAAEQAGPTGLQAAAHRLAASQRSDGSWPAHALFRARDAQASEWLEYSSTAVTTALCARALRLAHLSAEGA